MAFSGRRLCECPRHTQLAFNGHPEIPARRWVVLQFKSNRSRGNGGDYQARRNHGWYTFGKVQASTWSHVICLTCGAHWRTQSGYVDRLEKATEELRFESIKLLRKDLPKAPAAVLDKLRALVPVKVLKPTAKRFHALSRPVRKPRPSRQAKVRNAGGRSGIRRRGAKKAAPRRKK